MDFGSFLVKINLAVTIEEIEISDSNCITSLCLSSGVLVRQITDRLCDKTSEALFIEVKPSMVFFKAISDDSTEREFKIDFNQEYQQTRNYNITFHSSEINHFIAQFAPKFFVPLKTCISLTDTVILKLGINGNKDQRDQQNGNAEGPMSVVLFLPDDIEEDRKIRVRYFISPKIPTD